MEDKDQKDMKEEGKATAGYEKKEASKKGGGFTKAIFIIIMLAIGFACGFLGAPLMERILGESKSVKEGIIIIGALMICMYLVYMIQIIAHEAGHLLCGILSGYHFVSFRIGSFMLISIDGRIKVKRLGIVGTGGQCLMTPPERDGYDFPYMLYNMGGITANIVLSIVGVLLYIIFPEIDFLRVVSVMLILLGIPLALLNGIPMKVGGVSNDGYNVYSLGKDKEARHAFWLTLYINGLLAQGKRLRDMPEEWFVLPDDCDWGNAIICTEGMLRCAYLHDRRIFEEARELSEFLLKEAPGTLELHKNELRCELIFYEIIGQCRMEEIDKLYTKELQRYIKATLNTVGRIRQMYAYELIVKGNKEQAEKQLKAFEKCAKTYPYLSEIEGERELLELIQELSSNSSEIPAENQF